VVGNNGVSEERWGVDKAGWDPLDYAVFFFAKIHLSINYHQH
jgi:hypothetical protein